jgi:hypothetical protein
VAHLLCCVNALRGSPAERRLEAAQQAPDSFSPPRVSATLTPPISPLRAVGLAASAQQCVRPGLPQDSGHNLHLLVFPGGSGDRSREQCHDVAFL